MRRVTTAILAALALLLLAGPAAPAVAKKPHKKSDKSKLQPPKSLKTGLKTASTIQLKWKDRSKEKTFQIKAKPGSQKITVKRNSKDATIAGLLPKKSYKFKVRACKGRKCGSYTRAKKARTKSVPKGAPPFGFNESVTPNDPTNAMLRGSGAGFVRVPISWAQVEDLPGLPNFAFMDRVNSELARYGMRPLWVITGSPCWARLDLACSGGSADKAPNKLFYSSYGSFVAKVAKRYPNSVGVQVWNEPNIPKFWAPKPNAADYRSLLKQTAAAVRNSGSKVPVVYGAPSPIDAKDAKKDPKKIPATTFLKATLKGGVPGLGAVALHPYSFNETGDQLKNGIAIFDEADAVLDSVAPKLPVWVTEIGFTTAGNYRLSPEEQAANLSATYEALVKRGVKLISVHRLFDQSNPLYAFEGGMGVVESDRATLKPAYCSLAVLRGSRPAACG